MHMNVFIITLAEDAEDALSEVESWIDEYADREFFDYGSVIKPEQVRLVKDIAEELEKYKAITETYLPDIEKQIEQCKAEGSRGGEGYHHIRYGRILCEWCCYEMPFFNITDWDWSIPTKVPDHAEGRDWYAVYVDLHH